MTTILDWIRKTDFRNPEDKIISKILDICKNRLLCSSLTDVLVETIINNDDKSFEYLLEQSINLNEIDKKYALTPIMRASQEGKVHMVEKLLSKGADISNNSRSVSALTCALSKIDNTGNHIKCAKLLLKAGADIESVSSNAYAYEIATLLKSEVDRENIVTNKESETCIINDNLEIYVTNDGIKVSFPQKIENKKLVIKMLHNRNDPIPCYTDKNYNDVAVTIYKEGVWRKHRLIADTDYYLELPKNVKDKINYHYLPLGVTINGVITTENYICKFDLFSEYYI